MAAFAAAAPIIAAGVSGLFGLLSNRNRNTQRQTTTTTPTMDPAYGPLQQMLIDAARARLQTPTALPAGYEAGGVNTINRTFDLASQNAENTATSRGLSTSPAGGGVLERLNNARAGQIGQFRSGLPLIERDLRNQDMDLTSRLLNFGRGSTSTGDGSSVQESGGGAAGGGMNLMTMLGLMMGQGLIGGRNGAAAGGGASGVTPIGQPGPAGWNFGGD